MSHNGSNLEEASSSLELFSDSDLRMNLFEKSFRKESTVISEPDPTSVSSEWKGMNINDIYKGRGPYEFQQLSPVEPSTSHVVLFCLPIPERSPPKPHPPQPVDKWSPGFVRMPHSTQSLYLMKKEGREKELRCRWEVIQEALLQTFTSSLQLEAAILSYNHKYAHRWDFSALHKFFTEIADENEVESFFTSLLPKMIQLALQLPTLVTGPIPLLKRYTNASISLSQFQVASLLANAFFCTFPRRNSTNPESEYAKFPFINFNKLFAAFEESEYERCDSTLEKLKCIFHYFRRVTSNIPEGTITIRRQYIPKEICPRWDQQSHKLPLLHITSKGTIENEGTGLLQVDFANMYVGGGVLGWGCVQEEIRFVICPELLVTMLVTEVLDDTEALLVVGAERYSDYKGYSSSFKWTGNFIDETPRDSSGRRKTSIVAIDALYFKQSNVQYKMNNVIRELNKAFVGFSNSDSQTDNLLPPVATGNWGCGAFRGSPELKVLLQLMAAAVTGRSVVYFTFGDTKLRDRIADMYWHLIHEDIEVGKLFSLLSQYRDSLSETHRDLYSFLYDKSKRRKAEEKMKFHQKKITDFTITWAQTKQERISSASDTKKKLSEEMIESILDNKANDMFDVMESKDDENILGIQVLEKMNDVSQEEECRNKGEDSLSRRKIDRVSPANRRGMEEEDDKESLESHKKKSTLWDLPIYQCSKESGTYKYDEKE